MKKFDWFPVTWEDKKGNKIRVKFPQLDDDIYFEELQKEMDEIKEQFGDKFQKFKVVQKRQFGYGNDSWTDYDVYGWREQTDEEQEQELEKIALQKAQREEQERKQFAILKAKFEGSVK